MEAVRGVLLVVGGGEMVRLGVCGFLNFWLAVDLLRSSIQETLEEFLSGIFSARWALLSSRMRFCSGYTS